MEATTIIAILNSSFVLALFAFCAPQIGQCLNSICSCFGGPAKNEQQEVLLNNDQANNGQQEGRTNNGQEGVQTNNGQQGGLLGPTNNDQPAGGEETTGQSSSRSPANSSQIKNKGQSSGSHMLSARALEIKHADKIKDTEYWEWIDDPREPRFTDVAELQFVYHLEIKATVNFRGLSPQTHYAAYLIFKTKDDSEGLDIKPQKAYVKEGENLSSRKVCLKPTTDTANDIEQPQNWSNNWIQLELGKFFCNDVNGTAEISIMETSDRIKKTGLIVAGIEIRPIN